MDPMGGIVMTNDGNAILREITVQHPAAKTMIEIARTQDEEVGDGTTSVIVLAAEMLGVSHQFLEEKMHPTVVIQAYRQALEDAAVILAENVSTKIDLDDAVAVRKVIQSCVGTKFIAKWSDLACDIAMDAVKTVTMTAGDKKEIDIKRYAKVEKIPGLRHCHGRCQDCHHDCWRQEGDRHQAVRQGGEDPWRHHRGFRSLEGRHVQQGCHTPQDEEEDREPKNPLVGLQPRVQEGRVADQHRDHERGRLQQDLGARGDVH